MKVKYIFNVLKRKKQINNYLIGLFSFKKSKNYTEIIFSLKFLLYIKNMNWIGVYNLTYNKCAKYWLNLI